MDLSDISTLQKSIMQHIMLWCRQKKNAISQKEIVASMEVNGISKPTTVNALNTLLKKRYIRRGYAISNKTTYVLLRSIEV